MSLYFALAYAAGEGPQLPTTPLMALHRPDGRCRVFMQHVRHKDIVGFDGTLGKCDETHELVRVCKDMMM